MFSKNWSFFVIVTGLSTELSLCFTCGSERQTLMELGWGSMMMIEEELLVLPHVAPLILTPCSKDPAVWKATQNKQPKWQIK